MALDPELQCLLELTAVKGALPALLLLEREPLYAKQLAHALEISEETANELRDLLLRLALIVVDHVQVGGARGARMSLTVRGRAAAEGAALIAATLVAMP